MHSAFNWAVGDKKSDDGLFFCLGFKLFLLLFVVCLLSVNFRFVWTGIIKRHGVREIVRVVKQFFKYKTDKKKKKMMKCGNDFAQ